MPEVQYEYDVVLSQVRVTGNDGVVTTFSGEKAEKMILFFQEQGLPPGGSVSIGGNARRKTKVKRHFCISLENDKFLQSKPPRSRSQIVDRALNLYRASLPETEAETVLEALSDPEGVEDSSNTAETNAQALEESDPLGSEGNLLKF